VAARSEPPAENAQASGLRCVERPGAQQDDILSTLDHSRPIEQGGRWLVDVYFCPVSAELGRSFALGRALVINWARIMRYELADFIWDAPLKSSPKKRPADKR
jgi:hypothetical protein